MGDGEGLIVFQKKNNQHHIMMWHVGALMGALIFLWEYLPGSLVAPPEANCSEGIIYLVMIMKLQDGYYPS